MKPDFIVQLDSKGERLLRFLVFEIKRGRIRKGKPETFVSYSDALRGMGLTLQRQAGYQLQREGLSALNEWVKARQLPKITGLIIDMRKQRPGTGFFEAFGKKPTDREWWLKEADRAIGFEWSPLIDRVSRGGEQSARINELSNGEDYRKIITIEPGKRGGRPCIRGMRIAVSDVLGWLAVGMSESEIIDDFPELTRSDIHAALAFAADREKRARSIGHEIAL